jgi:hypothetical protein
MRKKSKIMNLKRLSSTGQRLAVMKISPYQDKKILFYLTERDKRYN